MDLQAEACQTLIGEVAAFSVIGAGRRKCESNWMVHRLHFEKNRYIYDLFYKQQAISKELYKFCIDNKVGIALSLSRF